MVLEHMAAYNCSILNLGTERMFHKNCLPLWRVFIFSSRLLVIGDSFHSPVAFNKSLPPPARTSCFES